MKHVALYIRVSTKDQSTELQYLELKLFVKSRGWEVFEVYEDKATGTNTKRPGLQRLLHDARAGKFTVIVCWKLDRLFRSIRDMVNTLHQFSELQIDFVSLKDNIDMTSPSGRLMTHLIAAFAEFEAALIRERVIAGLAAAKAKGKKLGRPRQYSHADIFRLRSKNMSLKEIAQTLGCSKATVSKTLSGSTYKKPLNKSDNSEKEESKNEVE